MFFRLMSVRDDGLVRVDPHELVVVDNVKYEGGDEGEWGEEERGRERKGGDSSLCLCDDLSKERERAVIDS